VVQLKTAYEECRLITRREAKNFAYAFITLPSYKRRAIYAVYAFCRYCDDAVDQKMSQEKKLKALVELRQQLAKTYSGHPEGAVFTALADTAKTFNIPQQYFQDVISGVEIDLTKRRHESFDELRTYCYQVASAVGLICLEIFGYKNPRAKDYAVDLGLAMQITNILRDVQEDLERDRIYIPQQDMEEYGYSEAELRAGVVNDAYRRLMSFQAQRARDYFRSGFQLLPYLSLRCRACPAVLAQIYSQILDRIERNNFDVFNGRISLTGREKLLVTAKTWLKSILPRSQPDPM